MAKNTIGIPYGRTRYDEATGHYWVHCAACGASFRGVGRTENQVTKSAALEYAIHYEKNHDDDA